MIIVVFILIIACILGLTFLLSPEQTLVIQLKNENLIEELKNYLNSKGIQTFVKNSSAQASSYHKLGLNEDPSLHVLKSADLENAIKLCQDYLKAK